MSAKLKVAVLGATGYSGLELTRLLLRHPLVEKPVLLRRAEEQIPALPQKASNENGQWRDQPRRYFSGALW